MGDRVSNVAAFVFAHGAIANEILFREADDEFPGLTKVQREAIEKAMPHLRETWVGVLTACRAATWEAAKGHKFAKTLQQYRSQPKTMWGAEKKVEMPLLVNGSSWPASCSASLAVWDEDPASFTLRVWTWTTPRHLQTARDAVASMSGVTSSGNRHWIDVGMPVEGDAYDKLGSRAAAALWPLARTIAEAISASKGKKK